MSFKKKIDEDHIKKKVIAPWFKSLGAWVYMPVQTAYGQHGIPDFVAGVPITITPEMVGLRVAILVAPEAKAPDPLDSHPIHSARSVYVFPERP